MKRMAFILITLMMTANVVFADDFGVPILSKDEIAHLSDTVLLDTYVDVCVEIEAAKSFRATSGFKPDEFKSFKDLLRYRVWLTTEIKKRKLEPPVVE